MCGLRGVPVPLGKITISPSPNQVQPRKEEGSLEGVVWMASDDRKRPRDSAGSTDLPEATKGHVVLNVGGERFETTVETLCGFTDSFFAKMFGGCYSTTQSMSDGSYFIDRYRSGEHFGQVLNFMRTHRVVLPTSQAALEALNEEMEYWVYISDLAILYIHAVGCL